MTLTSLLRSPLLHFFVLGGAIFAAFALLDDTPEAAAPDAIVLGPEEAGRILGRFEQTWNRPPSPPELEGMLRAWALEEAYVREATALGLDQNDPVIRQRLSLKMRFLAESASAVAEVDDETLQAHLEANPDRFRRPATLAFRQVPVSADAAQATREALNGGAAPETLADSSLLPVRFEPTPAPVIDRSFGTGFAAALAELPRGGWQGPVESGFGLHLVEVTAYAEGGLPALDGIRETVAADWRAEQGRKSQEAFAEALLARYSVELPSAEEVLAQ